MSAPRSKDGLEAINADPEDYRFTFDVHPRRVRVVFGGATVGDSNKVRVMRETRLAPVFYFPGEDVNWESAATERPSNLLPVQGQRILLVSGSGRATGRERRLEL